MVSTELSNDKEATGKKGTVLLRYIIYVHLNLQTYGQVWLPNMMGKIVGTWKP